MFSQPNILCKGGISLDRQAYKDEILFRLTGGVIDIELDDVALDKALNAAFREVQRYIDTTKIITIPYKRCIDFKGCNVAAVARVFRTQSYVSNDSLSTNGTAWVDPMYASQWQLMSATGNLYNFQDYVYNFASWNTLLQIRNTTSTDLAFRYDRSSEQLYINVAGNPPSYITVEFVPRYNDVSEIISDYWIDVIMRMAVAITKITLGTIRSTYTQTNALWTLNGGDLLNQGNAELSELRTELSANSQLCYPCD